MVICASAHCQGNLIERERCRNFAIAIDLMVLCLELLLIRFMLLVGDLSGPVNVAGQRKDLLLEGLLLVLVRSDRLGVDHAA